MPHDGILPECIQIFQRIEQKFDIALAALMEKVDNLVKRADAINGRYENHIKESVEYRDKVNEHDITLKDMRHFKWIAIGQIVIIAAALGTWLITWGALTNQVSVNTGRLARLEQCYFNSNAYASTNDTTKGGN